MLGLTGSILLIISQFLSWFSNQSLLCIYIITTSVAIEDSFLYLFPLISGIICLVGTGLIVYKIDYRINSVIINFVGLGFFLIFIFEIVTKEFIYLPTAQIGFYFSIIGSILIFFDILNVLIIKES
ncbi:MAG: hypothetical protein CEE42_09925 [Promethearchaeota archaeon Loki_b31]|nr:MAG: hypothetical protein CEE42_09925 [Candidatus Lokiarchaeota archaeon Loki_b31]